MTEEQYKKASDLRRRIWELSQTGRFEGTPQPGFRIEVMAEFIDWEMYNIRLNSAEEALRIELEAL